MQSKLPIYSMTGFGRGRFVSKNRRVAAEIKSVNNRYLDLQLKGASLPGETEARVARLVKENIQRGSVTLYISVADLKGRPASYAADLNRARALYKLYQQVARLLKAKDAPLIHYVLNQPDIIRVLPSGGVDKSLARDLEKAVLQALRQFNRMRGTEGDHMVSDLRKSAARINGAVAEIERLAPARIKAYEERLKKRMEAFLGPRPDETAGTRLAQEVTLMADKMDITEEISRLKSHQNQFLETLAAGGAVGKRLNFLQQEINREANTISSKAQDSDIIAQSLVIKEENEKTREMVQNLE